MTTTKATPAIHPGLAILPDHARVWVYKSTRTLDREEIDQVTTRGAAFVATWAAHGAPLAATVTVLYDRFVVIGVDEAQARASGCSIDKSVQFIQIMERDLNLRLTDRAVVWYEHEETLQSCRMSDIEGMIRAGRLSAASIVYDDLVSTKADLVERFRVPLGRTWLARYL